MDTGEADEGEYKKVANKRDSGVASQRLGRPAHRPALDLSVLGFFVGSDKII